MGTFRLGSGIKQFDGHQTWNLDDSVHCVPAFKRLLKQSQNVEEVALPTLRFEGLLFKSYLLISRFNENRAKDRNSADLHVKKAIDIVNDNGDSPEKDGCLFIAHLLRGWVNKHRPGTVEEVTEYVQNLQSRNKVAYRLKRFEAIIHYIKGQTLSRLGFNRYRECIEEFRQAKEKYQDPEYSFSFVQMTIRFNMPEEHDELNELIEILEKFIKNKQQHLRAKVLLATLLQSDGDEREATNQLTQFTTFLKEDHPDRYTHDIMMIMGDAMKLYIQMEDYKKADEIFTMAKESLINTDSSNRTGETDPSTNTMRETNNSNENVQNVTNTDLNVTDHGSNSNATTNTPTNADLEANADQGNVNLKDRNSDTEDTLGTENNTCNTKTNKPDTNSMNAGNTDTGKTHSSNLNNEKMNTNNTNDDSMEASDTNLDNIDMPISNVNPDKTDRPTSDTNPDNIVTNNTQSASMSTVDTDLSKTDANNTNTDNTDASTPHSDNTGTGNANTGNTETSNANTDNIGTSNIQPKNMDNNNTDTNKMDTNNTNHENTDTNNTNSDNTCTIDTDITNTSNTNSSNADSDSAGNSCTNPDSTNTRDTNKSSLEKLNPENTDNNPNTTSSNEGKECHNRCYSYLLYQKAMVEYNKGNFEECKKYTKEAIRKDSSNLDARLMLAKQEVGDKLCDIEQTYESIIDDHENDKISMVKICSECGDALWRIDKNTACKQYWRALEKAITFCQVFPKTSSRRLAFYNTVRVCVNNCVVKLRRHMKANPNAIEAARGIVKLEYELSNLYLTRTYCDSAMQLKDLVGLPKLDIIKTLVKVIIEIAEDEKQLKECDRYLNQIESINKKEHTKLIAELEIKKGKLITYEQSVFICEKYYQAAHLGLHDGAHLLLSELQRLDKRKSIFFKSCARMEHFLEETKDSEMQRQLDKILATEFAGDLGNLRRRQLDLEKARIRGKNSIDQADMVVQKARNLLNHAMKGLQHTYYKETKYSKKKKSVNSDFFYIQSEYVSKKDSTKDKVKHKLNVEYKWSDVDDGLIDFLTEIQPREHPKEYNRLIAIIEFNNSEKHERNNRKKCGQFLVYNEEKETVSETFDYVELAIWICDILPYILDNLNGYSSELQ